MMGPPEPQSNHRQQLAAALHSSVSNAAVAAAAAAAHDDMTIMDALALQSQHRRREQGHGHGHGHGQGQTASNASSSTDNPVCDPLSSPSPPAESNLYPTASEKLDLPSAKPPSASSLLSSSSSPSSSSTPPPLASASAAPAAPPLVGDGSNRPASNPSSSSSSSSSHVSDGPHHHRNHHHDSHSHGDNLQLHHQPQHPQDHRPSHDHDHDHDQHTSVPLHLTQQLPSQTHPASTSPANIPPGPDAQSQSQPQSHSPRLGQDHRKIGAITAPGPSADLSAASAIGTSRAEDSGPCTTQRNDQETSTAPAKNSISPKTLPASTSSVLKTATVTTTTTAEAAPSAAAASSSQLPPPAVSAISAASATEATAAAAQVDHFFAGDTLRTTAPTTAKESFPITKSDAASVGTDQSHESATLAVPDIAALPAEEDITMTETAAAASSAADPAVLSAALCQYTMGLNHLNLDAANTDPSSLPTNSLDIDPNFAPLYNDYFSFQSPTSKPHGLFFDHLGGGGPAPRVVGFPENITNQSIENGEGSSGRSGENGDTAEHTVAGSEPRIQAFAKLEFDDGHFYVNTHSLILGRDVRAARAAVQRELRAKHQARAAHAHSRAQSHRGSLAGIGDPLKTPLRGMSIKPEPNVDAYMGGSVVSDKGGIMGYDPDVPQQAPPLVSWKSSNSSAKNEPARPMLHMSAAEFPQIQPFELENGNDDSIPKDYNALAMQSLHTGNNVKPVDTLSLLPSPDACPTIPIHPPASANGTVSSHRGISRKHVKIAYNFDRNVFEMEVIGRNGAFIGPDWLAPGQVRPLHSGDYIQIGGVRVRFVLPDEPVGDLGLGEEMIMGTGLKSLDDVIAEDQLIDEAVATTATKEKEKKKKKARDASPEAVRAEAKSPESSSDKSKKKKKKKKKIKLKVTIPPSLLEQPTKEKEKEKDKDKEKEKESGKMKEKEKEGEQLPEIVEDKQREKENEQELVQEKEVEKRTEEPQQMTVEKNIEEYPPVEIEPYIKQQPSEEFHMGQHEQGHEHERESQDLMDIQDFRELSEASRNDPRPSIESPPPTTIIADGAIIQNNVPTKRRGPGRPPKDGIMSKRERAELAREQKMAAKREANGGITPPPFGRGKSAKTTIKEPSAPPPPTPIAPSMMATLDHDMTPVTKQEKRKYTKRKKPDAIPGENTVFMSVENPNPQVGQFGQLDTNTSIMMTPQAPAQKMLPPPPKKRKPSRSPSPNYPPENLYSAEDLAKPPYNYAVLIFDALSESQTPMTLKQIYRALKLKYPYFRFRCETEGWTSSVRHNLNGNSHLFEHAERDGKGWSWKLIPGASVDKEKKRRPSPPPSTSHPGPHTSVPPIPQSPQIAGPTTVAGPYGAQPAAQTFSATATASKFPEQRSPQSYQFPPPLTTTQFAAPQNQTPSQPQSQPQTQNSNLSFTPPGNPPSSFPIPAALRGNFPPSFATNSTSTYQSPYASAPPPEVLQAQAQILKASEMGQVGTQPHMPPSIVQPIQQSQPPPSQLPQPPQPRAMSTVSQAINAPQGVSPAPSAAAPTPVPNPSPASVAPTPVSSTAPSTVPASVPMTTSNPVSQSTYTQPAALPLQTTYAPPHPSPAPVSSTPLSVPFSVSSAQPVSQTPPRPISQVSTTPAPAPAPPPQPVSISAPIQHTPAQVPQTVSITPSMSSNPSYAPASTSAPAPAPRPSPQEAPQQQVPQQHMPKQPVQQQQIPDQVTQQPVQQQQQVPQQAVSQPPPAPAPAPAPAAATPAPVDNLGLGFDLASESASFLNRANAAIDNFESVLMEDAEDQEYLRNVLRSARNRVLHGATESSFPGGEPKDESVIMDAIKRIIGGLRE